MEKILTKKQLQKRDRNLKIKTYYQNLPAGMRSMRMVAKVFGVSRSTVLYAINGRKK